MSHYIVRELTNGNLMKTNSEKMLVGDYENTLEFWKESVRMWKEESEKLEAKNVELKNKLNNPLCTSFLYESRINELEKKLEIAVEALEFFEKIDNYNGGLNCNVVTNGFSVSREALSKIKSEGL